MSAGTAWKAGSAAGQSIGGRGAPARSGRTSASARTRDRVSEPELKPGESEAENDVRWERSGRRGGLRAPLLRGRRPDAHEQHEHEAGCTCLHCPPLDDRRLNSTVESRARPRRSSESPSPLSPPSPSTRTRTLPSSPPRLVAALSEAQQQSDSHLVCLASTRHSSGSSSPHRRAPSPAPSALVVSAPVPRSTLVDPRRHAALAPSTERTTPCPPSSPALWPSTPRPPSLSRPTLAPLIHPL